MSQDNNLIQIAGSLKQRKPKAGLYVVATPIGNKWDITLRALQILQSVDWIAAEDTRHSQKLLNFYGIDAKLISYHDHNEMGMASKLAGKIQGGESVALISDAGTPLISDPGYRLMRACVAENIPIHIIPGPSATIAALAISGLPPIPFHFFGFLPQKGRSNKLLEWQKLEATIMFFEAPTRLVESLQKCLDVFGDVDAAVARELTKMFEEMQRGKLSALIAHYTANEPKGEVTVLIDNSHPIGATPGDLDGMLQKALGFMSVKDAAEVVAREAKLPKRQVYKRAIELQNLANGESE